MESVKQSFARTRTRGGARALAGAGQDFDNMSEEIKKINKLRKTPPAILPLESYLTAAFPLLCGILISTNTPLCARVRSI